MCHRCPSAASLTERGRDKEGAKRETSEHRNNNDPFSLPLLSQSAAAERAVATNNTTKSCSLCVCRLSSWPSTDHQHKHNDLDPVSLPLPGPPRRRRPTLTHHHHEQVLLCGLHSVRRHKVRHPPPPRTSPLSLRSALRQTQQSEAPIASTTNSSLFAVCSVSGSTK